MIIMLVCLFLKSVLNLSDEDTFCDTLDDVVTSVKRNGVAIKGRVLFYLNFHYLML